MNFSPYRLLLLDLSAHSLLVADGPSGEIKEEYPYDPDLIPLSVSMSTDNCTAYIPAAHAHGAGALLLFHLHCRSLTSFPASLPQPVQFTLRPGTQSAFFVDTEGALYAVDLTSMRMAELGRTDKKAACVGLVAARNALFAAWDQETAGSLTAFADNGRLLDEIPVPGIPTNLILSPDNRIIMPYTAGAFTGEGIAIFADNGIPGDLLPTVITIQCCREAKGHRSRPAHVAVAADRRTAYIVNEESASVTTADLDTALVTGYIPVGRSISRLYILPDERFAVATSHMFADLSLIDLVNRRLITYTDTARELAGFLAVLPSEN